MSSYTTSAANGATSTETKPAVLFGRRAFCILRRCCRRFAAPARVRRYEHFCAAKISAQGGFISPGAFLIIGFPQKQRFCGTRFRFPPSLKNPISLKRPRPGAAAPALDPAPAGRKPGNSSLFTIHFSLTDSTILLKSGARSLSHGCAVPAPPLGESRVQCAPGERQRKEK